MCRFLTRWKTTAARSGWEGPLTPLDEGPSAKKSRSPTENGVAPLSAPRVSPARVWTLGFAPV